MSARREAGKPREGRSRALVRPIRRIVVRPEQVEQADRRPWAQLTLTRVMLLGVGFSAILICGTLLLLAVLTHLAGLW